MAYETTEYRLDKLEELVKRVKHREEEIKTMEGRINDNILNEAIKLPAATKRKRLVKAIKPVLAKGRELRAMLTKSLEFVDLAEHPERERAKLAAKLSAVDAAIRRMELQLSK